MHSLLVKVFFTHKYRPKTLKRNLNQEVDEMKARAERNRTFLYVKVTGRSFAVVWLVKDTDCDVVCILQRRR